MKKLLYIMAAVSALGCKHEVIPAVPQSEPEVLKTPSRPAIIYNDEVLCYGSTGGILPYLYSLLKTQNFNACIQITDATSVQIHGRDRVLKFYEGIDVSYTPKLLSIARFGGDSARLRYKVWRYATARFIDIVTVTRDSVKMVLPTRLDDFLR